LFSSLSSNLDAHAQHACIFGSRGLDAAEDLPRAVDIDATQIRGSAQQMVNPLADLLCALSKSQFQFGSSAKVALPLISSTKLLANADVAIVELKRFFEKLDRFARIGGELGGAM
jgi:hypothetical protein